MYYIEISTFTIYLSFHDILQLHLLLLELNVNVFQLLYHLYYSKCNKINNKKYNIPTILNTCLDDVEVAQIAKYCRAKYARIGNLYKINILYKINYYNT